MKKEITEKQTGRGALTRKIQEIAKEFLGQEMTLEELRLIPYLDYCSKNSGAFKAEKIGSHERPILRAWKEKDYIDYSTGQSGEMHLSKPFYEFICKVLWESYVTGWDA